MLANEGRLFTVRRYDRESRDDEWLRFRRSGIGGSDVAGIMGLSSWASPISIWSEKTGRVEPADLSGNEWVEWGTRLESVIRERFKEEHPETRVIHPDVTLVGVDRPWAHANLDGMVRDPERGWGVLEVKTASSDRDWFDEDGSETVPIHYQTQATHYLTVTGYGYVMFAVLVRGSRYMERLFVPDEEDVETVRSAVDGFWNDYVLADAMPTLMTGLQSESQALYGMYAEHADDMLDGDAEMGKKIAKYKAVSDAEKRIKSLRSRIGNELKEAIGDLAGIRTASYEAKWIRSEKRDSGLRVKETAA